MKIAALQPVLIPFRLHRSGVIGFGKLRHGGSIQARALKAKRKPAGHSANDLRLESGAASLPPIMKRGAKFLSNGGA